MTRVLGLTGGMGAGKTYVATLFSRYHWPVFDSDQSVRRLQALNGAAVAPIRALWPEAVCDGAVDRIALRAAVIGQPARLRQLEAIMHPLVRADRGRFLRCARAKGARWVVLDIPLLFETHADAECDEVLVITAPAALRARRVMLRRSLTQHQARALIDRQMPDVERVRRANYVIRTGLSRGETFRQFVRLKSRLEATP